jgi:hypothetical protein
MVTVVVQWFVALSNVILLRLLCSFRFALFNVVLHVV